MMKKNLKNKLKSNKGFTMQDLIMACLIITLFVGIIATTMFSVFKVNAKLDLSSQMTIYAVQILEDIDKISYEEVQTKTGYDYKEQFSIPDGFDVILNVSDYGGEGVEDVIKIVDLTVSYTFQGETDKFTVKRLKIKEI